MENEKTKIIPRPPVVVVMGHVDHGKSSILESIKDLKITSKESGGITQHTGAYEIEHEGKKITFIDTPGHEAFFAMRQRGSKVADIAVLVVASDESVKKQTEEAISHIKKENIPVVVAINKVDKTNSNPDKVKLDLAEKEMLVESMGGKIPSVNVSAATKQGIPDLLETILLIGDMEELKGDLSKKMEGTVIESHLDPRRGPVANAIIKEGTLKEGDDIWSSSSSGKAKIIENFKGERIKEALPSMPVLILGFEKVPHTGERISAEKIEEEKREKVFSSFTGNEGKKTLNIIIKADVLGSLEAAEDILKKIPQDKVLVKVIKADVGSVDEADIKLVKGTGAKIIALRAKTSPIAKNLASRENIRIVNFDVIYEFADAVRNLLLRLVEPEIVKKEIGKVKILEIFKVDKKSQVIGGRIISGVVRKNSMVHVYRNNEKLGEGKITGLQCGKKNAGEVPKGEECGMMFEGDVSIERGDVFSIQTEEKVKGEL